MNTTNNNFVVVNILILSDQTKIFNYEKVTFTIAITIYFRMFKQ